MSTRPVPNAYLRVSDTERQEVADILKQHATDGRLDQAEFEERLDRTLRAKTRADLGGLLDDLPHLGTEPETGYGPAAPAYNPAGYGSPGYGPPAYGPPGYGRVPPRHTPGNAGQAYGPRRGDRAALSGLLRVVLIVAAVLFALSFVAHTVHFAWVIVLIVGVVLWRRNPGWHRRRP